MKPCKLRWNSCKLTSHGNPGSLRGIYGSVPYFLGESLVPQARNLHYFSQATRVFIQVYLNQGGLPGFHRHFNRWVAYLDFFIQSKIPDVLPGFLDRLSWIQCGLLMVQRGRVTYPEFLLQFGIQVAYPSLHLLLKNLSGLPLFHALYEKLGALTVFPWEFLNPGELPRTLYVVPKNQVIYLSFSRVFLNFGELSTVAGGRRPFQIGLSAGVRWNPADSGGLIDRWDVLLLPILRLIPCSFLRLLRLQFLV